MILDRTQLEAAAEGLWRHLSTADAPRYCDTPQETKDANRNAVRAALHAVEEPIIVVTKRAKDYHAGCGTLWGNGDTPAEAIGNLIRAHTAFFNVSVNHAYKTED